MSGTKRENEALVEEVESAGAVLFESNEKIADLEHLNKRVAYENGKAVKKVPGRGPLLFHKMSEEMQKQELKPGTRPTHVPKPFLRPTVSQRRRRDKCFRCSCAVFFYWISNNCFSLVYGTIIKRPEVRKFLSIPDIPKPPPGSTPPPAFSLADAYKNYKNMFEKFAPLPVATPAATPEPPKLLTNKKRSPTSSLNQKLGDLEKQVKGRKKNKRK